MSDSTYYAGISELPNGERLQREQLLAEAREKIQREAARLMIGAANQYGTRQDVREATAAYVRLRAEHLERQVLRSRAALANVVPR